MNCGCQARPCIHDRLPHLVNKPLLTLGEKRNVREILEFFNPKASTPETRPSTETRTGRETPDL